jgi:hypothetical protein
MGSSQAKHFQESMQSLAQWMQEEAMIALLDRERNNPNRLIPNIIMQKKIPLVE